jgi:hypothetical protein
VHICAEPILLYVIVGKFHCVLPFFSPSGYSPSPGDLAYPEKLEMMENIADHLARQQLDHQQGRMTISTI